MFGILQNISNDPNNSLYRKAVIFSLSKKASRGELLAREKRSTRAEAPISVPETKKKTKSPPPPRSLPLSFLASFLSCPPEDDTRPGGARIPGLSRRGGHRRSLSVVRPENETPGAAGRQVLQSGCIYRVWIYDGAPDFSREDLAFVGRKRCRNGAWWSVFFPRGSRFSWGWHRRVNEVCWIWFYKRTKTDGENFILEDCSIYSWFRCIILSA